MIPLPELYLIPQPRQIESLPGGFLVPATGFITLASPGMTFGARRFRDAWLPGWKIAQCSTAESGRGGVDCRIDPALSGREAYRLEIRSEGVELRAGGEAGIFYGLVTLGQIARRAGALWPALRISDWPDYPRRGFYHDVSRGKVPKLHTILQLVDDLADLKINEFQLYMENVFEFRAHPEMYEGTDPLTAEELLAIDEACRQRYIDFVPSLTSLGHFDKILRHPRYRALAEAEPQELQARGIKTWSEDPWSLCVVDPGSARLVEEMYGEFLPQFSSALMNICCDESWDLGKGRSAARAEEIGPGELYLEWVLFCRNLAGRHGREIQFWGDIILNHPELIPQLPPEVTLLEWGYEADHPFEEHAQLFRASGRKFYICPGTSTWLTLAGRTGNALANLRSAAQVGLAQGASGFLNTDWGDHGHQQFLSISYLPMAYGAAGSWHVASLEDPQILAAISSHVLGDPTGRAAELIAALGETFTRLGALRKNASVDFFLFREAWEDGTWRDQVPLEGLERASQAIEGILPQITGLLLHRPDGVLIRQEWILTAREILHTLERTRLRKDPAGRSGPSLEAMSVEIRALAKEFSALWLARNKPSRLADVLGHFQRLDREYQQAAGALS